MKITILGSGFIGLTTAYFLQKNGHEITIVDRNSESGRESSFANGAQLSYCHAEPWASKSSLKNAIKWLGKKEAPLLFRLYPDPDLIKWLFRFVDNARESQFKKNNNTILKLNLYSRHILHKMENEFDFDWDYKKDGKIFIYRSSDAFEKGLKHARFQETIGSKYQVLNTKETLEKEPALENIIEKVSGAIFDPLDESGDGYKFAIGMQKKLEALGVKFLFDTKIEKLITEDNKIKAVKTDKGNLEADLFILAAGAYSPVLSKTVGLKLPIYPLKGYSITVPIEDESRAPKISITDSSERVVYSRVGNNLRVAGTAEIAGYSHKITKRRIKMLRDSTERNFTGVGDIYNSERWSCLRSCTPDGAPILGKTKFDNLILNTGQGSLGWTQNFASAQIVTDIIEGKTPEIDITNLTHDRYGFKNWIKSLN
jgi:D-amino-acid dehydrogenase